MGFLHKIWDDTLAGPAPDSGLGKLRKYNSFQALRSAPTPVIVTPDQTPVSRSITILRSNSSAAADPGSGPVSPAGPSTPTSPFSPSTPRGDFKRFTRRKTSPEAEENADPRNPIVYDWIVINALDR